MQGYKTLIFGGLLSFLGGIQATDLATVVPPQYTGIALAGIGLVTMILRTMTTTPVGKKVPGLR